MHDYSADYGNYKIYLPNVACNVNYKNNLDNYVDNYKRVCSYCEIELKTDKHCEEFHKFFGDKKYGELSILSCVLEGTSRRIKLLSDNGDKQSLSPAQQSANDTATHLDLADYTFPVIRNPPQTEESITRHFQNISGVTFSARNLLMLFILYIVIRISLKILVLYIAMGKLFSLT
ncbi:PIR Superfamily Protein [Plasmodium ovale wallikeri]|uniref:PIR Superfamily Protein n=2 Tax=Plasmodium ovale TaxID=36330 RepID=A0A1A9AHH7_PLAOA|nr:PIR Superfamily Protein [Plasmodium ovale wallikeri]SBT59052.1 PIR Superfamily Protein [Plasmodium ovale wallikeri]SBT72582.1 hypothetical protein POWCR01_000036000 [Plasmodium ovale]